MQLYGVVMTVLCIVLLVIIIVQNDELNDYRNFVHELKDELDEKTRKCESFKAQLKRGE
jgi:cell division protein FtsL